MSQFKKTTEIAFDNRTQMIESLEARQMFSFAKWPLIGAAIAKVPYVAGPIASTAVVKQATTLYSGRLDVRNTLTRIRNNKSVNLSGDGNIFSNTSGQLPAGHGTWYEFFVDPKTGTDHNFGNAISLPGPMRLLLASDGDTFFSGDGDLTFQNVFTPPVVIPPTIGSFTVSPGAVTAGDSITLTASNVVHSSGTVSNVQFYLDVNRVAGLQNDFDLLLGTGIKTGVNWSTTISTANLSAGTYTYYAVAIDVVGVSSQASSATLTVAANVTPTPTVASLTASSTTVSAGVPVTLTANNVIGNGASIGSVKFYRESNSANGLQIGVDTLLGTGTPSGSSWKIQVSTSGLSGGYIYYAVATDSNGVSSAPSSVFVSVQNPVVTGGTATWNMASQTAFGSQGFAAITGTAVSNTLGLTRGSGVTKTGTAVAGAWGGSNWAATSAAGISSNAVVTFGITLGANTTGSLSSINLNYLSK